MGINMKPKTPKASNKGDLRPTKRKVDFKDDAEGGKVNTIRRANSGDFQHAAFKNVPKEELTKTKISADLPKPSPGPVNTGKVTPQIDDKLAKFSKGSKGIKMKGKC